MSCINPYAALDRKMRDLIIEMDPHLLWADLERQTRRDFMIVYLAVSDTAATLSEALANAKPRESSELHLALITDCGVADVLWVFLEREIGPALEQRWEHAMDDVARQLAGIDNEDN